MNTAVAKNLALLATTVILALVVGESAARYVFRDITTTADNRSYFAIKWKRDHVHLNSLGFREKEFDRTKQAGAYRIAFIGDSYTFGQGIAEQDRMSNLLEKELRPRRGRVEVLNFGNAGNNTADEWRVLQRALTVAKPDFVLLQWFVNDVEDNDLDYQPPVGGEPAYPSRFNELKMRMRNASVLYFLAAETWHRVRDRVASSYVDDLLRRFGNADSRESQQAERALLELFKVCRDNRVPVGVFLVPYFMPLEGKAYPFAYLHERVLALCRREGVSCVDLMTTFAPYMNDQTHYRDLWVNRFDSHMSPLANRLATARLLEVFGPRWTSPASALPTE